MFYKSVVRKIIIFGVKRFHVNVIIFNIVKTKYQLVTLKEGTVVVDGTMFAIFKHYSY